MQCTSLLIHSQDVNTTEHSQHIGEMGQMLKNRLRERTIIWPGQLNTTKPVGVHFRQQG